MNESREYDVAYQLTHHAHLIDALREPAAHPEVFYENMSGALIWEDEISRNWPSSFIGALRFVFGYRTSLMLGEPRRQLQPAWDLALTLFPKWIGFRRERREANPQLLEVYRRGDVSLRWCLRKAERESERE